MEFYDDGNTHYQRYRRGSMETPLRKVALTDRTGTTVSFDTISKKLRELALNPIISGNP